MDTVLTQAAAGSKSPSSKVNPESHTHRLLGCVAVGGGTSGLPSGYSSLHDSPGHTWLGTMVTLKYWEPEDNNCF